jgi:hypothetical protein
MAALHPQSAGAVGWGDIAEVDDGLGQFARSANASAKAETLEAVLLPLLSSGCDDLWNNLVVPSRPIIGESRV